VGHTRSHWDELIRSGRDVTLAVGEHVRVPRTARPRRVPSPQLTGTPDRRSCDLNGLHAAGVAIVGGIVSVSSGRMQCSGSLANLATNADLKQNRLLDRIDAFAAEAALDDIAPDRPEPTTIPTPATEVSLAGIDTVIWATGSGPATLGSTMPCSTAADRSSTKVESWQCRGGTWSASRSSGAASPASSTGSAPTPSI
jgi:hypothetical protein